jgi:hypothetical protein
MDELIFKNAVTIYVLVKSGDQVHAVVHDLGGERAGQGVGHWLHSWMAHEDDVRPKWSEAEKTRSLEASLEDFVEDSQGSAAKSLGHESNSLGPAETRLGNQPALFPSLEIDERDFRSGGLEGFGEKVRALFDPAHINMAQNEDLHLRQPS